MSEEGWWIVATTARPSVQGLGSEVQGLRFRGLG